ncbi:hypothetical protein [Pseudaestuariivita sp.]|uniref:hypothetical protein n=1 Tax=Pseudaestuariivita sp. TaxID=2211669 RepID=UPI004059FC55
MRTHTGKSRALAVAACALLAGPALAQAEAEAQTQTQVLCSATGADSAALVSGDWTVRVISSRTQIGNETRSAEAPVNVPARLTLTEDGTGTFAIGGGAIPLTQLPPGQFHLDGRGPRTLAFADVMAGLERRVQNLPCPLAELPQMRAEVTGAEGTARAATIFDFVLLDGDTMAGVQFTRAIQPGAPDVTQLTAMILTRTE